MKYLPLAIIVTIITVASCKKDPAIITPKKEPVDITTIGMMSSASGNHVMDTFRFEDTRQRATALSGILMTAHGVPAM